MVQLSGLKLWGERTSGGRMKQNEKKVKSRGLIYLARLICIELPKELD